MEHHNVLFVEDNVADQMVIEQYLTKVSQIDYELTICDTFTAAKELLADKQFDLLILDLNLPDCKSLDGVKFVRENHSEIPLVVFTGLDDESVGLEAIGLGAQDYLVKGTVNEKELSRVLSYALARNKFQRSKQFERELSKAVIESAPYGICVANLHGSFLLTNVKFREMVGYKHHDLVRMSVPDITHPEDQAATRKVLKEMVAGEKDSFSFEKRYVHSNGTVIWGQTSGAVLTDEQGRPEYILLISHDITESRLTTERLQRFMDETDHKIAIFDKNLCLLEINEAALEFIGAPSKESVIGQPLGVVSPDMTEERYEEYRKVLEKKIPVKFTDRVVRQDSNPRMIRFNIFPLDSGCAVMCHDITVEWEAQELLRSQTESLQQFAYIAAHDLKAPLANMNALLGIIEKQGGIREGFEELFTKVEDCGSHMHETIEAINEVVSLKQNIKLDPEENVISDAVDRVLQSIEIQIIDTKAKISTDFSAVDEVYFPKVHLNNIIQNLLTNAIKYRRPGVDPKIHMATLRGDGRIGFTVCDNGKGLDLNKYGKKLFGIFERFDNQTVGKGIGLHITKTILENYDGSIEVESIPGHGSTFTVWFANVKPPMENHHEEPEKEPISRG